MSASPHRPSTPGAKPGVPIRPLPAWLPARLLVAFLATAFLGSLSACAGPKSRKIKDPAEDLVTDRTARGPDERRHDLSGGASYYAEKFHGRTTASGERFDMHGMTAAHRTLPFHTIVRVIDPKTHKSVVVRINDRGPHVQGRVIDLSWAAARDLDLIERGVIQVRLKVLQWGDGSRVSD